MRRVTPVSVVLLLAGGPLPAEEPRRTPPAAFAVGTERVTVDFVVRDKKNAILHGIGADELEVYEDGVQQDVESLDFIDQREAARPVADAAAPAFVAVAFDRLSPGARGFARQAVADYLDFPAAAPLWMGIF